MGKKVFCSDCKYLYGKDINMIPSNVRQYECNHSMNFKRQQDWLGNKIRLSIPEEINRHNDCEWYDE